MDKLFASFESIQAAMTQSAALYETLQTQPNNVGLIEAHFRDIAKFAIELSNRANYEAVTIRNKIGVI